MSRSGYSDDLDYADLARWRGAVNRALYGKRGQALLREMLVALDALPEKVLIAGELRDTTGDVCAMGAVCVARELDTKLIDYEDKDAVAEALGIAPAMAAEIAYQNDEAGSWKGETPAERWTRVRAWVERKLARRAQPQERGAEK